VAVAATNAPGAPVEVTCVAAVSRHGQTFITWKDVAEGDAAAQYRYDVYRSDKPFTSGTNGAERCLAGVLYYSAKQFGSAFNKLDRLNPDKPTAILEPGGKPLPMGSGLGVVTVPADRRSYYAVVATDIKGVALDKPVPGRSATAEPVDEKVAPIQPILREDSMHRKGPYIAQTCVSGQKGLPLFVELHASSGQGGGAGEYGDCYLYFSRPEWGWMDGLPGVFSVDERRDGGNHLMLRNRDAIVTPQATPMETYWFGYVCVPQWAIDRELRAYNFTERRTLWTIEWVIRKYEPDPERVYANGGSMGAWGSTTFAFRHPEIFAAVYPNRPRIRQRGMPALEKPKAGQQVLMDDAKTPYLERMDLVRFATEHHEDLPAYIWCCGRRDGFATWQEQVDMVKAMTASHHGFAFAWNDGDHSSGAAPMAKLMKYYGADKFRRNRSYPAFGNSSINNDPGPGDPKVGDMEGGINLGFSWNQVVDEESRWSVTLSNDLCQAEMTVDVTPRRCQKFKPAAAAKCAWSNTAGGSGEVVADAHGLVTVNQVKIKPGETTVLLIETVR
jgi:hypothetical protein